MRTKTYLNVRSIYYLGIGMLVLYSFPSIRLALAKMFDFTLIPGVQLITLIAIGTGYGALMAYLRKFG